MQKEKENCLECKKSKDLAQPFSCCHVYCTQCLCRKIFTNHINEFRDCELIKVKCRCDKTGFVDLNFQQILEMVKKIQIIDSHEKDIDNCFYHQTEPKNYFCKTCNYCICNLCYQGPEHKEHTKISNEEYTKRLRSFIETLPLKSKDADEFIHNFDKLQNEFKQNVEDCLDKSLRSIDEIIQNLNSLKNEYKKIIKKKLERGVLNLKILKYFYTAYYHCYRNREDVQDVNVLMYLKDIKYELEKIQVHQTHELPKKLNVIKEISDEMKKSPQDVFDIQFVYKRLNLKFSKVAQLSGHTDKVFAAIQLRDGRICTGSEDFSIRFWQEIEGEFKNTYTITEFTGKVIALLQLKDERIISSSNDSNTNKVWAYKSNGKYECDLTLSEHQNTVYAWIQMANDLLVTGSKDTTIKVWTINGNNCKCIQTIKRHESGVYTLCELKDNKFASGGDDSLIMVWGLLNGEYMTQYIMKGHKGRVRSIVQLNSGEIVSGGDDLCLRIWKRYAELEAQQKDTPIEDEENVEIKEICSSLKTVHNHKHPITWLIQMKDGRIVSASKDKTIRIWEYSSISDWGLQEALNGHNHIIFCVLQLQDGRILSAGGDFQVFIWKSGKMEGEERV